EEATAGTLGMLGIGFTVWHDVSTGDPEQKLDHILLGPTGLIALISEDFGGHVRVRRGELIGDAVAGQRPMHDLAARAKIVARRLRVRFSGLVIVLPDDALDEAVASLGMVRGAHAVAVRQSALATLMRSGIPGSTPIGGNELFDVRTRLLGGVQFV
ncbi:MAG: molecular chaperone DnaJ, partial [Rhodoglobus sp.]